MQSKEKGKEEEQEKEKKKKEKEKVGGISFSLMRFVELSRRTGPIWPWVFA